MVGTGVLCTTIMDLCPFLQVTNHLTRDRDSRRVKPALGRSWSFVPSTRILLDVIEGAGTLGSSQRVVCLTKSPRQVSQPRGRQGSWALERVVPMPTGISLKDSLMPKP